MAVNNSSNSERNAADRPIAIAAAIAIGSVAVAVFNLQPMYLGALADHLGFSAGQLGLIAGVEVAGSAIAGVAAIFWVRLWNWRRVALIALLTMVIGNIASAFVTDFVTLATIRFCTGLIGAGTAYALSVAALSDTRDVDKNFSITIVAMVSVAIVGFLVLPPYIAELGPQAVFWSLAFIATITLPMIRSLPTKSHKSLADETNHSKSGSTLVWLAVACQCVWYMGLGGVWAFVERLATDANIAAEGIGQALAIGLAVGLIGAFAAALLADRFGRIIPFTIAMLGQVAAVVLLVDLESISTLIIAICVYNTTWNFALPYLFAVAAVADTGGRLVVLMTTAQALGLTIGAMIAGTIVGRYGLEAMLYQGGILAIAALAIYIGLALRLPLKSAAAMPD